MYASASPGAAGIRDLAGDVATGASCALMLAVVEPAVTVTPVAASSVATLL